MQKFLLRRLVLTVVTLLLVSLLIFLMARVSGDPSTLLIDDYASAKTLEDLRISLGLDKSYTEQYWIFLKNAVRGDFGQSIVQKRSVGSLIVERLVATFQLGLAAFLFSIFVGVPLGVFSAIKRDSLLDQLGKLVALIGQSAPPFWIGIMLMFLDAWGYLGERITLKTDGENPIEALKEAVAIARRGPTGFRNWSKRLVRSASCLAVMLLS